jgi:hypothetical protein
VGSEHSAAPNIRPARDEDVEALVQLTLAAFVPVFRSFEQMLGPDIYRMIWPAVTASIARSGSRRSAGHR